ncbi:MAG: endonuclease/exonuclease/phosphatase (EEP) superfamily protein YafD [Gammaproteobacteria bacterium]
MRAVHIVVAIIGISALSASVAGYFGTYGWLLDLCAHFRVHYVAVLLAVFFAQFWLGNKRLASVFLLGATVNAWSAMPVYSSTLQGLLAPAVGETTPVFRILALNVNTHRGDPTKVAELIDTSQPDAVMLFEVNTTWLSAISSVTAHYPFRVHNPREDNFGIALFSRLPLREARVFRLHSNDSPTIEAVIEWPTGAFQVVGIHPVPPFTSEMAGRRNGQMTRLGRYLTGKNRTVLVGDYNATPWSTAYRTIVSLSKFSACQRIPGWQATWPNKALWLGIPIDHCLASADLIGVRQQIGASAGSDHRPVLVEVPGSVQGR